MSTPTRKKRKSKQNKSYKTFDERKEKGILFENYILNSLNKNNAIKKAIRCGAEYIYRDIIDDLKGNYTKEALIIKFSPDGIFLTKKDDLFYWETKDSIFIEKNAYKIYIDHYNKQMKLILFIKYTDNKTKKCINCWQFIDEIKFINNIPIKKEKYKYIDEEGWVHPHDHTRTPYKLIDKKCLIPYNQLNNYI